MESLLAALLLAALHAGASALRFLDQVPRSRWLSAAGGVALAYVFVHLLPELAEIQVAIGESGVLAGLERHAYVIALAGITTFYVLEQLARRSGGHDANREIGWIHLASYAVYNALIGYVLVERQRGGETSLWPFVFAMGVHFVVNDHGLRRHHKEMYRRVGRWLLAAAILAGWSVAQTVTLHEPAVGVLLSFIAGGVILNVLKEELPGERQSRLLPFVTAAGLYGVVLLTL